MKKKGGGAPLNNKNAAGPHNSGPSKMVANRLVTYKTGVLGSLGIGKTHTAFGYTDKNGSTTFAMPNPKKPGTATIGLPRSARHIKIWHMTNL